MHEVGHVLGIGWADDTAIKIPVAGVGVIPKGMEVYSGDVGGDGFEPDQTPEYINTSGDVLDPEWSIMMEGTADDTRGFSETADQHADQPVLAISIEELSTASFEDVPTREEDE